mmetsp:Transcript_53859/g.149530  ORF Transcript_53859/g.149530 Transcript_53859/m.149530 type:complete len:220 (-) Transcript_53859:1405-2064(-)
MGHLRPGCLWVGDESNKAQSDAYARNQREAQRQNPLDTAVLPDAALLVGIVADKGHPLGEVLTASQCVRAQLTAGVLAPVERVAEAIGLQARAGPRQSLGAAGLAVPQRSGVPVVGHQHEGHALARNVHELGYELHCHHVAGFPPPTSAEELVVVHNVGDHVLQQEAASVSSTEDAVEQHAHVAHEAIARVQAYGDEGESRHCQESIEGQVRLILAEPR